MNRKPLYHSLLIFLGYSAVLLAYACERTTLPKIIGHWAAGFLAFTLLEYVFHRWFFHMRTGSARRRKLQYSIHGNHHAAPHKMTELMMKPAMAIVILIVTTGLFYGMARFDALALLPGFLCGYSCYLSIHFAVHAFRPPKNFLRILWKQHSLHHFNDDSNNFGVSSPLWDLVFGTYVSAKNANQKIKTNARTGSHHH